MAKFDPEHATVPDTNFSDRNSAEQFLECGKFRRCANLRLPLVHQSSPPVNVYIPICTESRFNKAGVAQDLPMPNPGSHTVSPIVYMTVGEWAPLISCPRKCKGYRNRKIAALFDRVKSLKSRITTKKWTMQEKVGLVAIPILVAVIAFLTPELRRALRMDKTNSQGNTTTNAPGGIVNNGGVINNPTINNGAAPSKGTYELTDEQRMLFRKQVSTQTAPRDTLRIGCTSWSESSCVAAGSFLLLFSEAGWRIEENKVFRLQPQIPIVGVAITTRTPVGEPKEPLPPHQGRWRLMDESHKTIYWAFNSTGIPIQGGTDDTLKEGTLGIYFGSEPK